MKARFLALACLLTTSLPIPTNAVPLQGGGSTICELKFENELFIPMDGCANHELSWSGTGSHGECHPDTSDCQVTMIAEVHQTSDGFLVDREAYQGSLRCARDTTPSNASKKEISVDCPGGGEWYKMSALCDSCNTPVPPDK